MKTNGKKGFTLIELLIVIAIIGILAAALIPNIIGAPAAARDTQRLADLSTIAKALEQYSNVTGSYPTLTGATQALNVVANNAAFTQQLKGGAIPKDPTTQNQYLICKPAGYSYMLYGTAEKPGTDPKKYIATPNCTPPGTSQLATPSSWLYMIQ